MTSTAILGVKEVEVQNLARRYYLGVRGGPSRSAAAAGAEHYGKDCTRKDGTVLHGCRSSPFLSSMAPGASMPARTAKGRCCQVRTRCCFETTMPAAIRTPLER